MKYLLAVDGGGTKTHFSLSDPNGVIIRNVQTGSTNYKSVGLGETYIQLHAGIKQLCEQQQITRDEITFTVFGMSGCDSRIDYNRISDIIKKLGFTAKNSILYNDAILAFYAQTQAPGIVIIAGTGSIVMGVDKAGRQERAGGWGYNISDIGSGYWIGIEAMKKTLLYCDGCHAYSPLFDDVREFWNCRSFAELPYIVTQSTDYFEIAKIANLVGRHADQQETVALGILQQGSTILGELALHTIKKLKLDKEPQIQIVLSGGTLRNGTYQQLLKEQLRRQFKADPLVFYNQVNEPSYGGIKQAMYLTEGR